MSIVTRDLGFIKAAELLLFGDDLSHHGVLGMRWGVRRGRGTPTAVTVRPGGIRGKKLKTKGGEGHKPSAEAVKAAKLGQIKKKSGAHALTNEELQTYAKRMNLEQQVNSLEYGRKNAGKKFVASLVGNTGKTAVQTAANEAATKKVKSAMAKRLAKGAATAAVAAA